jgi:hypothetical protein
MRIAPLVILSLAPLGQAGSPGYFVPVHRVPGIGVARDDISDELLNVRTGLMIEAQTFSIMRDPLAVPGARRITSPKLQSLFRSAAQKSGLPASLIEAIAYLESWGEPNAESLTGPKGIMQISEATAHTMGLKVSRKRRYRVTRERIPLAARRKGKKPRYKTIVHRVPYAVTVRDDRLNPSRAVPAAARYLAGLEEKFGGRDWAIFAYHCGPGCVGEMLDLTRRARGIPPNRVTVPGMFFSCSPVWNRELYQAVQQQMLRDYSPTYYFRVMRAMELLALYRRNPQAFQALSQEYHSDFNGGPRAPHRLSVWLKRDDLVFHTSSDIRADMGRRLVKLLDRPDYYGYTLRVPTGSVQDLDLFPEASPAAVGTLTYIAFETRRLHEMLNPPGEEFRPLPVTSLVQPGDDARRSSGASEALSHSSGQVFDIEYSALPPGELECLRFVLDDLGWEGYLGFIEEGRDNLHIGCSPSSRELFSSVFEEALGGAAHAAEAAQ